MRLVHVNVVNRARHADLDSEVRDSFDQQRLVESILSLEVL